MSALASLYAEIEKAGLIQPGPRPLKHRIGFLVSTIMSDRKARIGRYLERRVATPGAAKLIERNGRSRKSERVKTELFRRKRIRTGTYNGIYSQPGKVRKSEHDMDAIDGLYAEVEKALGSRAAYRAAGRAQTGAKVKLGLERIRGRALDVGTRALRRGSGPTARRLSGMLSRSAGKQVGLENKIKRTEGLRNKLSERIAGNAPHGAKRWIASNRDGSKRKGNSGFKRHGVYKALEAFDAAVAKALAR